MATTANAPAATGIAGTHATAGAQATTNNTSSKKSRWPLVGGGLGLILLIGFVVWMYSSSSTSSPTQTPNVTSGTPPSTVSMTRVATVNVSDGVQVTFQGELIALLPPILACYRRTLVGGVEYDTYDMIQGGILRGWKLTSPGLTSILFTTPVQVDGKCP